VVFRNRQPLAAFHCRLNPEEVTMHQAPTSLQHISTPAFARCALAITTAVCLFFAPILPSAAAASSRQEHEPLGSLATVGLVYVNGAPSPGEVTIFSGDSVLTSESGSATFTMSGKGSFKLSPQTHLAFTGDARYVAELTSGTVVMTSFAGATDVTLKTGNFVVAPVIQTAQSSSRIDKIPTGGFLISCLDGSIGVLPLEGANGQVLRVGQTVQISPVGELSVPQEASLPPANNTSVKKNKTSYTPYIILGVAGAGAAGAAIALSGHGHSSSSSAAAMSD